MTINFIRNKLAIFQVVTALLLLNLAACAANAWGDRGWMRDEVRRFHAFLQDHPRVSADLQHNPRLVSSQRYLDQHEDLDDFLRRHPTVRRELLDYPERVFGRYYLADDYGPWRYR